MSTPQKSLTDLAKVVLGGILGLGLLMFLLRRGGQDSDRGEPSAPVSAAQPSATAPVSAPAPVEYELETEKWLPPPAESRQAPPLHDKRLGPDTLLRLMQGTWRADGGARVSVDPPRPPKGRRTRYHLILEREDRTAFGCDFDEDRETPQQPSYDRVFRAWCGGEAHGRERSSIGFRLDGRELRVHLVVDKRVVVDQTFERAGR